LKKPVDFYNSGVASISECLSNSSDVYIRKFEDISYEILNTLEKGKKIIICGNGGSAAHAQHLAAEFLIRLNPEVNRPAFSALALTLDNSTMTACGNDYSFREIFSRPLSALGEEGDSLILLSTSGNSTNLLEATKVAQEKKIKTIAFLGKDGGKLKEIVDMFICFNSNKVSTIQEAQIVAIHAIANFIEYKILED